MELTRLSQTGSGAPAPTPTQALTRGFVTALPAGPSRAGAAHAQFATGEQARQGFRIGELRLMIRYEDGSELTELPEIYSLPNAPDWFPGIANLHGALTPVFDLARYCGVTPDPQARRMLLVLLHGADAAGVVIDGLPLRLRRSPENATDSGTAPPRLAPHVREAALIADQLWFDLDCAALLAALEQEIAGTH